MSKKRNKRRKRKRRKGLGFALGHKQGFTISTRDHAVHPDRKKEANKKACRGRIAHD